MSKPDLSEELASARKELKQAQIRAEAFTHLSHEIRTLLHGVIGITGLLLDTELSAEQRDYAKRIRTSGDALLGLLNDILDFSKLEANKVEVAKVDFDLQRTVDEVGELLAERAYKRGLELLIVMPHLAQTGGRLGIMAPFSTSFRGDPVRLRQVLINLVSNAIKFTDQGEVVLKVASITSEQDSLADRDGLWVRFEVTDTGVGISPEGKARLFQPFSQVHDPSRSYGGTGLGLAFAKRLVEALGGEIGVESEPGRGSTFWFTVRLEQRTHTPERSSIPHVDVSDRRILVTAANEVNRRQLGEVLEGFEVDGALASEGREALGLLTDAAIEGRPFDVVILDAALTDMDGGALVRAIDADPRLQPTRIVAMTYPGQRLDVPDARIAARLAKPVRKTQLQVSLFTALGSGRDPSQGRGSLSSPPSAASVPSRSGRRGATPSVPPRSEASSQSSRRGPSPSLPPRGGRLPRPRLLVVEDNAVNQRVAAMMVQKRGYDVDVVENGYEAIEAATRTAYDAVLMDCQMPKLDGFSATAEIRKREGTERRTPIIAMTANAGPGAKERCFAAGMDDYLSKPIVAEELDRVLERWAPRRTPPRSILPPPSKSKPKARITSRPPSMRLAPEAGAPSSSSAAIDYRVLDKLRALRPPSEPDLAMEVIELFLADAPVRISALREGLAGEDMPTVIRVAHTLKGSAGHLGAKLLATLCMRLEQKARAGDPFNVNFAITSIEEEFDRVRAALLAELSRPRGGG